MLLLLSHDIMITPCLLRITPYHAICCALPSLTAECCAWLTHIHYMNTYMPSMPFISHMHRYMDKQSIRINTASWQNNKISSFAPQSKITTKHYLAGISNSIVSSVLSHWVLPYFAVASAPFETCLLESCMVKIMNILFPPPGAFHPDIPVHLLCSSTSLVVEHERAGETRVRQRAYRFRQAVRAGVPRCETLLHIYSTATYIFSINHTYSTALRAPGPARTSHKVNGIM
jgi:hypothetical protein